VEVTQEKTQRRGPEIATKNTAWAWYENSWTWICMIWIWLWLWIWIYEYMIIYEYMNIWYGLQAIVDEQWQNYRVFLTLMDMSWTQFNIAPQKTWSTKGHTCHSRKHPLRHKSWNHTRHQAAFTSW
jgi:hypothetical protein